ncbi:hypothetical protein GCM10010140_29380 [Streptosporangium pseudovulgare]|uniref:Uncharacterized protein n=1 Tax=Streptosporangium pseudovulgare TaxID=35765 RepID=A0ABQ2QWH8_9ACTN|nr:hypothetical protein GCM10010140_29380 [Streptosporangium pseudovulgare]
MTARPEAAPEPTAKQATGAALPNDETTNRSVTIMTATRRTDQQGVHVVLPQGPPALNARAARELLEILLEAHAELRGGAVPDVA